MAKTTMSFFYFSFSFLFFSFFFFFFRQKWGLETDISFYILWSNFILNRKDPRLDPEDGHNFYKLTHLTITGEEKLKTRLSYQPCATPSHLDNVDWQEVTQDNMLCNGGELHRYSCINQTKKRRYRWCRVSTKDLPVWEFPLNSAGLMLELTVDCYSC